MSELRKDFTPLSSRFIDVTGTKPRENTLWPPVIITKEAIDAEVERLANVPARRMGGANR